MAETVSARIRGRFTTCELVRREELTEDLIKFWIKPAQPFVFKPGQYCTIGVDGIERPYSIVSSPDEEEIELFIEVVPVAAGGHLTPLLDQLDVGAEMTLRPRAKGLFLLDPQYKHHIFVGTVTGVVPYLSILRKFLGDPEYPEPADGVAREDFTFHVLEGASYLDEFGYDEELIRLASEHDFIKFYPTVSRPTEERNADWTGAEGRINLLVEDYVAKLGVDPVETCIYACGHPQMIEDVGRRFADTDYAFVEERFWKEDE
jgi:ferredoxin--NADP+ reductase